MAGYKRGSSGHESPAAMRFGRSPMHKSGDVEGGSKSASAPKKGYGDEGSRTPGGKKKG